MSSPDLRRLLPVWAVMLCGLSAAVPASDIECPGREPGRYRLYWGDLHVHTAMSMDAYVFGTRHDPGDAFAYARGQPLLLSDGRTQSKIDRPLDFMAVTDHAETFDVMYLCSDPEYRDGTYCEGFRDSSNPRDALSAFRRYLLPVIAGARPARPPLCSEPGIDCDEASRREWRRAQAYANAADAPCEFTAFIGSEWSATPDNRHWHRNLIFASDSVTEDVIDYVRYPDVSHLWGALDEQCRPEQGCDVITIPHNGNLSESGNFAVEDDTDRRRAQRIRYERLVEVYQSKGSSECLPEHWDDSGSDCRFELLFPRPLAQKLADDSLTREEWRLLRGGYARHLLSRGLEVYQPAAGPGGGNPLQLGLIGSTDNHSATPGNTAEDNWTGDVWAQPGQPESRFQRLDYSPGGLVAVWAEQNSRASLFDALKQRRVYGTSGTRIGLRFIADRELPETICRQPLPTQFEAGMGGQLNAGSAGDLYFVIQASMDQTPLARVEIIKGVVEDGTAREEVHTVADWPAGTDSLCVTWRDRQFDPQAPAYWYVRILELPTPRWSRRDCLAAGDCARYPGADQMIQERAWSSPIWHLPVAGDKPD